MKKIFYLALALIFAFTACKKDKEGVFNPKLKIKQIRVAKTYIDMDNLYIWSIGDHVSEEWSWNDKLLERIVYYNENGQIEATASFLYAKKRLSSITVSHNNGGTTIYNYNYQDKYITSIDEYYNNELTAEFKFSHNENKITRIEHTRHDWVDFYRNLCFSPIRYILSPSYENIRKTLDKTAKKNGTKAFNGTYIYELQWENENIKTIKITSDYDEELWEYTYSDKTMNPYYGSFLGRNNQFDGSNNLINYAFPASQNIVDKLIVTTNYGIFLEYNCGHDKNKKDYPWWQSKELHKYIVDGVERDITDQEWIWYEYI